MAQNEETVVFRPFDFDKPSCLRIHAKLTELSQFRKKDFMAVFVMMFQPWTPCQIFTMWPFRSTFHSLWNTPWPYSEFALFLSSHNVYKRSWARRRISYAIAIPGKSTYQDFGSLVDLKRSLRAIPLQTCECKFCSLGDPYFWYGGKQITAADRYDVVEGIVVLDVPVWSPASRPVISPPIEQLVRTRVVKVFKCLHTCKGIRVPTLLALAKRRRFVVSCDA
jgi:hypothetical protein